MKLTNNAITKIKQLVANPQKDTVISLIRTGSILRYLNCQDQLGKDIVDQLLKLFDQFLPELSPKELISLYKAMSKGLPGVPHYTEFRRGLAEPKRPSLRSISY